MSDERDPRIFFAAERTLLAWNRTSLALIAFGFLVERAGLLLVALFPGIEQPRSIGVIFWVGIGLMALGAFTAGFSSRQYLSIIKSLAPDQFPKGYNAKWGVGIQLVVALFAVILIAVLVWEH